MKNEETARKKFTVSDIVMVGLMAAVCWVATNFRIEIPTPVGKTMIHFGNIFCLLSGLLLGGVRGGLSAGIGSCFFDLLGGWATSAPSTLIFKFIMGLLAGKISHIGNRKAGSIGYNVLGSVCGMYSYVLLYVSYSFVKDLLLGSAMQTALMDIGVKALTSTVSGTFAIVIAVLLAIPLRRALEKSEIYKKLGI
ncbi:MAG: ECF transporter S component [Oscillospiraceae bacterium]